MLLEGIPGEPDEPPEAGGRGSGPCCCARTEVGNSVAEITNAATAARCGKLRRSKVRRGVGIRVRRLMLVQPLLEKSVALRIRLVKAATGCIEANGKRSMRVFGW